MDGSWISEEHLYDVVHFLDLRLHLAQVLVDADQQLLAGVAAMPALLLQVDYQIA